MIPSYHHCNFKFLSYNPLGSPDHNLTRSQIGGKWPQPSGNTKAECIIRPGPGWIAFCFEPPPH